MPARSHQKERVAFHHGGRHGGRRGSRTKLYYGSQDEDATELSVVMVDTEDEQNSLFSLCPVTSLAAAHNLNLTEELLWSTSS